MQKQSYSVHDNMTTDGERSYESHSKLYLYITAYDVPLSNNDMPRSERGQPRGAAEVPTAIPTRAQMGRDESAPSARAAPNR